MSHEKVGDNFLMQLNLRFRNLYSHLGKTTLSVEILDGEPFTGAIERV